MRKGSALDPHKGLLKKSLMNPQNFQKRDKFHQLSSSKWRNSTIFYCKTATFPTILIESFAQAFSKACRRRHASLPHPTDKSKFEIKKHL